MNAYLVSGEDTIEYLGEFDGDPMVIESQVRDSMNLYNDVDLLFVENDYE